MRGGKRQGAGRPVGTPNKLQLRDYLTQDHINEFIEYLIDNYKESDKLMMWMGDHLFGRAPQAITGADGGPLEVTISGVEITVRK